MRPIQRTAIRFISVLSFLFAIVGFYSLAMSLWRASEDSNKELAYVAVFWSRITINAVFLVLLGISARYLWQLRAVGLRISNILFTLELAYVFVLAFVENWLVKGDIATSLARTAGTGNMGVSPQMVTLYPFIALLVLNAFWPNSHSDYPRKANEPSGVTAPERKSYLNDDPTGASRGPDA